MGIIEGTLNDRFERDGTRKLFYAQTSRERERKKGRRKEKKRKGKKKKKGRKNTTFLRRRGFSSRRVNDQPVVETNNDIMVIQGSTFSSSWRIPSLSVPSLDPLYRETKLLQFLKPNFPFCRGKSVREIYVRRWTF